MDERAISFGPFRLLAGQRLLLEGDRPVRIGSRAFDVLAALVQRAGEVVGKDELIACAWPRTFVKDSNLKIQVSALRRALGDGQNGHRYVVTVPGRGYNFVAPVNLEEPARTPLPTMTPAAAHNLPYAVTRVIGRDDAVAALVSRLPDQRLLTIVGPGGIGKTTVALAVAERVISRYEHGVWLVDLAPLADPRLVASAIATVLGLEIRSEDPIPALVAGLKNKRLLLLLDNCEHVIDAAAGLASAALGGAPGIGILATSREPLRVAAEREYHLGPLASPVASPRLTAALALGFPAVQLFVERTAEVMDDFSLRDVDAPLAVEICRRLDGLPLAIEFAAARVCVLGLQGVADHLDQNLRLLGSRRRTVVPRHRTMLAVLDWSYGLLSEDEQQFFRALGIFSGAFTAEAAAAAAADAAKGRIDALDRLAGLVTKSLVAADVTGAEPRFRLLDTTRAYAIRQLDESSDRQSIARRHAAYYRDLFARAEAESAARPTGEWIGDYAREIDNLRAALDWAFSPAGDGPIGVQLVAAAVPLWWGLSLVEECRSRARQALGTLGTAGTRAPREEMRLHAALGASTPEASEMGAAFAKALDIAESLGDLEYQLRALRGLYFFHAANTRYRIALRFAQRFYDLAASRSDPNDQLFGERIIGAAEHFLGDHRSAKRHFERVLSQYLPQRTDIIRFQTDLRVAAHAFLARVLWLQGFPDQARRAADASVEDAKVTGHPLSLCYALTIAACPVALWVGDLIGVERSAEELLYHSREHSLLLWNRFGSNFKGVVVIKGGDLDAGLRLLRIGLDERSERKSGIGIWTGVVELAEALVHAGRIAEGLAVVDAGIDQSEADWLTPELLRLKGEFVLLQAAAGAEETSAALFRKALSEAHRQGALSWELRTATSLARLLRRQGRTGDAAALLQPVYDRFTEGFDTADLIAAKRLLDSPR